MKKFRRIIPALLALLMLITTLTGCGGEAEEINVYTKFQDLSDTERFDFEVNAKLYSKVIEDVEIGAPKVEIGIVEEPETEEGEEEETEKSTVIIYDIKFTFGGQECTMSIKNTTTGDKVQNIFTNKNAPASFSALNYQTDLENKKLVSVKDGVEDIAFEITAQRDGDSVKDENVKKEEVTTETHYNLRLIGTYLGPQEWVVKVFAKDIDVKGYTNVTNIYRKGDDVYVDIYSMVDSLDYLLEADGNIKGQFDFKEGNYIKTTAKGFADVVNAESQNRDIKLTDLIGAISTDLSDVVAKGGYDVVLLDNVFDQVINIAKETATAIEAEVNKTEETEETEKKKKKDEENAVPLYSFSSADEEGKYTFILSATDENAKQFINKFGTNVKANIKTKIQERIDYLTADMNRELKKKEERPDHTAEIAVLNEYLKMEDFWVVSYAEDLSKQDTKAFNTDLTTSIVVNEGQTQISVTYSKESDTSIKGATINIKINKTTHESISLPTNVIDNKDQTLAAWNNNVRQILEMYANGTLENDESDLTPERIVAIGKLVKPSQNDDFKYKIYDRYISISQYIGKSSTVKIPDTIDGLPVYVIEASAFEENKSITKVEMTDNIIIIGKNAFRYCEKLTELQLSKNLIEIPEYMCQGNTDLTKFEIPYGVKSIGMGAFKDCESITELAIPSTVAYIGSTAFQKCVGIKTIVVMDGTLYDENDVYIKTIGLTIDSSAFAGNTAETIILPSTVISIADDAFTPDRTATKEAMFYGYTPSQLNLHCAKNKYLFTTILAGGEIDEAIKDSIEKAMQLAKSL